MPRLIRYQHWPATTIAHDRAVAARVLAEAADKPIRRVAAAQPVPRARALPFLLSANRQAQTTDERVYAFLARVGVATTTRAIATELELQPRVVLSSCSRLAYHNLITRVTTGPLSGARALWSL